MIRNCFYRFYIENLIVLTDYALILAMFFFVCISQPHQNQTQLLFGVM